MSEEYITIDLEASGKRLDRYLSDSFTQHSRSYLQQLIDQGKVLLNDKPSRKSQRLAEGDQLKIQWPAQKPRTIAPETFDFPILFQDDYILVINKPAGISVHPGAGQHEGTLVNALLGLDSLFEEMMNETERPGIVHRLDKNTSGVLVVAKTPVAMHYLSNAFAERLVHKQYLAIVDGQLPDQTLRVDNLIGRHKTRRQEMAVVNKNGKQAISTFTICYQHDQYSLVKAEIETGRTHQIRVHLKHLGCPVLGDPVYGKKTESVSVTRQMLHAWKLSFPHPDTKETLTFCAELPADFRQVMVDCGLRFGE